ncbi:MAG: hypothetical protein SGJ09_02615 [Phycisphaerae bacterium]|nr:hypothetical protein [Phycisphaerae bacterium]
MASERLTGIVRGVVFVLAGGAFAAWLVGFAATDRWVISQYLWWIPWLAYAAAVVPAAGIAWHMRSRPNSAHRFVAVGFLLVIVVVGLWRDVGFGRGSDPATASVSIVHWNASWPESRTAIEPARRILARGADVVVISNPYRFFGDGREGAWRREGYDVVVVGIFAIASRVPLLEARQLFAENGMAAASFVLDAREQLGRTVRLVTVDLPSNPELGRYRVAANCAKLLAENGVTPADIVLGDFNITRSSASLSLIAPGMRDAWDDAGVGWGASWPRVWPVLHLDHVMLAPELRARRYELFDPRAGVHRAQGVWVESASPQTSPRRAPSVPKA